MNIALDTRALEHVRVFYEASKDEELRQLFPFMDQTLEGTIQMYQESKLPTAKSYGKIVVVDGTYVGDVWCYCIDEEEEKSCFYSIVIFDKAYWGQGIGTKATELFIEEIRERYNLEKVCAFTYKKNIGSVKTLEKVGFVNIEEFEEDGVASYYLEKLL